MREILSLWRSPLDEVALAAAAHLGARQPRDSIGYAEDFSAMTIFNYGYYVTNAGGDPATALTNMFLAMTPGPHANGGTAFISQTTLPSILASTSGFAVPDQCNIIGAGGGGIASGPLSFYHFTIDYSGGPRFFSCTGNYTAGGRYFRSLAFAGIHTTVGATCIYAGTQNCCAVNCTFTDIPVSFNAQGQGCALEQCTIDYDGISGTQSAPVKAVIIGGAQCGVRGPGDIFQKPQTTGGPKHCTGVSIEGAEHTVVARVHLSDWNTGIDFSQRAGAQYTQIVNCEIQSWQYALNIQLPAGPVTAVTSGITVTSCLLAKYPGTTDASPVVNIDPQLGTGNTNNQLSDITLLDCTVINYAVSNSAAQHGLAILGGTNIRVIGGTYSNNSSNTVVGGAGIAILGPCGDVQIIGVNLQPSYPWSTNQNNQTYGVLVSSDPAGTVYIADCDLTGYTLTGQQAVKVTVPISQGLLICNCPGYNDRQTALNGGVAPTSSTNAATCTTPYFGPSVIAFSNPTAVSLHVFGQTITLSYGIFLLPSPYDSFYFATAPATFSWIGK